MRDEAVIGLIAFAFCVLLAAPGTTWYDGGELALAAATLGVAHAPGEPAYLAFAALASLLPVGDVSFRLTLLSAATVAGSAACMVALGRRFAAARGPTTARVAGLFAGAATSACPLVVLQGVRPELYGLALLLGLLGTLAVLHGGRRGVALAVLPLALVGAVHHVMLVAALPGLVVLAWTRGRHAFIAGLGAAGVLVLPALGLFAWLPLRSWTFPALDFLSPRTLERVLFSVTGRGYARSFSALDATGLGTNIAGHLELAFRGFGVVGLGLGLVGLLVLARDRRAVALGVGALVVAVGMMPTVLQGVFDPANPDAAGYLMAPVVAALLVAGLGLAVILQRVREHTSPGVARTAGVGLAIAALLTPFTDVVRTVDASELTGAATLGDAVLDDAPPGAVVLLSGDSWVFPALLARYHHGRRADVEVVPLHLLDTFAWETLRARGLPIGPMSEELTGALAAIPAGGCCGPELIAAEMVRTVPVAAVGEGFLPSSFPARVPDGLLYRFDDGPVGEVDGAEDLRAIKGDPLLEGTLGRRAMGRAGFLRRAGDGGAALSVLKSASAATTDPWALVHLHRHRLEEGVAPIGPEDGSGGGRATTYDGRPTIDGVALRGTIRLVQGDLSGARDDLARVLATHPDHPVALPAAERLYTLGSIVKPGAP